MVVLLHKPFNHCTKYIEDMLNYRMKSYIFVRYKKLKKKDYVLSCARSCIAFMTNTPSLESSILTACQQVSAQLHFRMTLYERYRNMYEKNPSDGLHSACSTAVANTNCNFPALNYELLLT